MFPSIEIHLSRSSRILHPANDQEDPPEPSISCEMDYQHQSETILVVPDLCSTTISIDPSSAVGGAWLVESKKR